MKARKARIHPPWFAAPAKRIRFLYEFGLDTPTVKVIRPRPNYRGGFALATSITPSGVPTRNIELHFSPGSPLVPSVFVDGPADSPHRYSDDSLCMWYPYDPPEARWLPKDGPAALLGHIAAHLIKEQWYRQTGEWPGDEVGHPCN